MRRTRRQNFSYCALVAGAFVVALLLSWTFGGQIDNYAYDALVRLHPPPPREPESMILAIEEATFRDFGGIRGIRRAIADRLERIAGAQPKAVAVDVILADSVPEFDNRLEQALARTPKLILDCLKPDEANWEYPADRFQRLAAAVGHVYVQPDLRDQVAREIPLAKTAGTKRYWALALEAFRVSHGVEILPHEPAGALKVGNIVIPGSGVERPMLIRYATTPAIPRVSIKELKDRPELASRFTGKTVLSGETTATSGDRKMTPLGECPAWRFMRRHSRPWHGADFLVPAHTWMNLAACDLSWPRRQA